MDPVHNFPERPTHPVRAVLFDYGKVLTNAEDQGAWAAMLALTGVSEARFHAAYWTYRHDFDRHTLDSDAYWRSVADHAGTTFSNAETARLKELDVNVWTNMNDRMVDFARNLQRAGIRWCDAVCFRQVHCRADYGVALAQHFVQVRAGWPPLSEYRPFGRSALQVAVVRKRQHAPATIALSMHDVHQRVGHDGITNPQ